MSSFFLLSARLQIIVLLCIWEGEKNTKQVMNHWAVDLPICFESEVRRMHKANTASFLFVFSSSARVLCCCGVGVGAGRALFKIAINSMIQAWYSWENDSAPSSFPDAEIPTK